MKGVLYLIPSPLGDVDPKSVIPQGVLDKILELTIFIVEEIKTTRRYLSKAGLKGKIDGLQFFELNEHTQIAQIEEYIDLILVGNDVGMISEAGLPAVADPGAKLVELCHKNNIKVVPMVGPSSLMMALMTSGKNGQNFAFNGYLPIKPEERRSKMKQLEKISISTGQSQIIIETPYRNNSLLADFLSSCNPSTKLCIACNISLPDEYIKTLTIEQWKREKVDLNKRPAVFIL